MKILWCSILVVVIAAVITLFCLDPLEALSTIAVILALWLFTAIYSWTD